MTVRGRPFYYGWVIVAAFFVLNAAGQASGTLNFGFFVIPMAEELGLSRQAIGWAQTMRLWASGLSGILIGRWLDRHGPRGPMLLAIVVATGGLLLLARAESPAVLFGVLLALGITGWTAPAGGALIATVPVSKWFIRQRGRATGIVQLGLGVGGAVFVALTQALISTRGWRSAWVTLAWLSAATVPLILLLRRQPGDMGLEPDGGPPGRGPRAGARRAAATSTPDPSEPVQWTLKAAIRTASLWKLSAAFAILGFLLGAASVHRIPHWIELGFHPATVSLAFSMDAGAATIMALAAGFVVERLDARIVGLVSCLCFCVAVALMAVAQMWAPAAMDAAVVGLHAAVRLRSRPLHGRPGGDLGAVLRLAVRGHDPRRGAAVHLPGQRPGRTVRRCAARRVRELPQLVAPGERARTRGRGADPERPPATDSTDRQRRMTLSRAVTGPSVGVFTIPRLSYPEMR